MVKKSSKTKWPDPAKPSGRTMPEWMYTFQPDDRNRLIEEARDIVHGYLYCADKGEGDYKLLDKAARRWLKETKP